MADTFDLFRKLSSGANFDREKYREDTALIQVLLKNDVCRLAGFSTFLMHVDVLSRRL